MYVVSFVDFIPEPRFDGISWTRVEIKEAATADGPYTIIAPSVAVGADTNPAHPQPRSFTTNAATLVDGWYLVTFMDASGNDRSPVAPVHFVQSGNLDYLPTVQQIARKDLSRTRDKYGNLLGSFTVDTLPTDTQVAAIANDVITEIADTIGDEIPADLWDDAQDVVALRTAMQIELDFFPDQVNTGRSTYPQLREQYLFALDSLQKAVAAAEQGGDVVNTGPSLYPSYSFPDPGIGYSTRW